jgi:UDPglucose 6-dehydrogenase
MHRLHEAGVTVVVYEPGLNTLELADVPLVPDLDDFITRCDLIISNRMEPELDRVRDKVFTRDVFGSN